jgi:hypothetical protein
MYPSVKEKLDSLCEYYGKSLSDVVEIMVSQLHFKVLNKIQMEKENQSE